MKLIISFVFVCILMECTWADVNEDIQDLINLYPKKAMKKIFDRYNSEDIDVIDAWMFFTSNEVQDMFTDIEKSDEFSTIKEDLTKAGVDVQHFVDMFNNLFWQQEQYELLGQKFKTITNKDDDDKSGLAKMLDEFIKKIPDTLTKMDCEKKEFFNKDFKNLVKLVNSDEFIAKVNAFVNSKLIRKFEKEASDQSIDIDAVNHFFKRIPICKP